MTTTLMDVNTALAEGHYRQAREQLQVVLETQPSADAWYLAAQFTMDKDPERAVRHLKRALMLNPRHGDSLSLLGQLGSDSDFTIGDVAEELGEAFGEQVDHAPILRMLTRPQQLIFMIMVIMVVVLSLIWAKNVFFPVVGPEYIPEEAPQAATVTLHNASDVINQVLDSDFTILGIQYVSAGSTPGKRVVRFSVPGEGGHLQPVQVIVYDSISTMVRDQATQSDLARSSDVVASGNAMLAYSKNLEGLPMEDRLLNRFAEITGS